MNTLVARGITVSLGGRNVVTQVDCDIRSGQVTAIVGPNGAGKSSLIRALAGVHRPTEGTITWKDLDWLRLGRRERARIVAVVEQDVHAELPLTVRQAAALGRTPHLSMVAGLSPVDERVIDTAMTDAGIAEFADRQLATLSGGERQRAHLARGLAQQPGLLLLDEPTNHLDVRAGLTTLALARRLAYGSGMAVAAALHDLNHAMTFADHIVVLDHGHLRAAGTPSEVLTPELIAEVWGVSATVFPHPVTAAPIIAFDLAEDLTR